MKGKHAKKYQSHVTSKHKFYEKHLIRKHVLLCYEGSEKFRRRKLRSSSKLQGKIHVQVANWTAEQKDGKDIQKLYKKIESILKD